VSFAENLRRLRLEHFLSQSELARLAGIHAVTVTRLEVGTTLPSMRTVRVLAAALGIEPRELAAPSEVAEVRRIKRSSASLSRDADRIGAWNDDGGASEEESPTTQPSTNETPER
jgi:transcriptional regulator with XRE-family HTH domain